MRIVIEKANDSGGEITLSVRILNGVNCERKTLTFARGDQRLSGLGTAMGQPKKEPDEVLTAENSSAYKTGYKKLQADRDCGKIPPVGIAVGGLRLAVGVELTVEDYELLCEADEYRTALRKGADLLSYGANSQAALRRKLVDRGIGEGAAGEAASYFAKRGFIDEAADAESIIRSDTARGYGPRRIIMKLRTKGYCDEVIEQAIDGLSEVDFAPRCAAVIRKRYGCMPADKRERDRIVSAMIRQGYSYDDIKRAARIVAEDTE